MNSNRASFEAKHVVDYYATTRGLQAGESAIVDHLGEALRAMHMLDLGVGAGRTTEALSPLVRHYVGLDYAAPMIDACKRRFSESEGMRFVVGDACALTDFNDATFDFVLFSYNGIDCIASHEGRTQALGEIARVLKPGGYFAFSTHNLARIRDSFSLPRTRHPIRFLDGLVRAIRMRIHNPPLAAIEKMDHAILRDSFNAFRSRFYYIRPSAQQAELRLRGFSNVKAFSAQSGKEIAEQELDGAPDKWVYFLCQRLPA